MDPTPSEALGSGSGPDGPGLETRRLKDALARRLFDAPPKPVQVGRFAVLDVVGEGGMGVVYAAYDPSLDRKVAVKVLHATAVGSEGRSKLEEEAAALAKLGHPNVVTVHEVGVFEGGDGELRTFMAMEYVGDGDLSAWAQAHPRGGKARTRAAIALLIQAAEGVAAAHAVGLVHRDLKPGNLLVGKDGRLRVGDFGLVLRAPHPAGDEMAVTRDEDCDAPSRGDVAGTPAYMPPEQLDGQADARSDQWSLCASFWEVFTGVRPYPAATVAELRAAFERGASVARADDASVPTWLRRVLLRGLALDPAARFTNVDELVAALRRGLRPPRWRGAAAGLILGGALVGGAWWSSQQQVAGEARRCPDPHAELAGIWDTGARQALQDRIAASGKNYADDVWTRVRTRMDGWVEDWATLRSETCASPDPDPQVHADRLACLDRARDDFARFREMFVGDEVAVGRLPVVLATLASPDGCRDRAELKFGRAGFSDPVVSEAIGRMRLAHALSEAGQIPQARAETEKAFEAADAADLPALRGRASDTLAQLAYRRNELEQARAYAEAALADGEATGRADIVIMAWTRLGWVALKSDQADRVPFYVDRALSWAKRPDAPPGDVAHVYLLRGQAELVAGRPAEALEAFEQGKQLLEKGFGPDHTRVGRALVSMGSPLMMLGRTEDARRVTEEAYEIFVSTFGPTHPETASIAAQLAQRLIDTSAWDAALETATAAKAVLEANPGERSDHLASCFSAIATARRRLGDRDGALAASRAGLEFAIETFGPESQQAIQGHFDLASGLNSEQKHAEARAELEIVLAHRDKMHPLNQAIAMVAMAELQMGAGERETADEWAQQGLTQAREILDEDSAYMVSFLAMAGRVEAALGRTSQAREHLQGALSLAESHHLDDDDVAAARLALAALGA